MREDNTPVAVGSHRLEGRPAVPMDARGPGDAVVSLDERARDMRTGEHDLLIVDGTIPVFEQPGTLDRVVDAAGDRFGRHLPGGPP